MGYREMIKKVQLYSGFSDQESQDALDCTVETLASMLTDEERHDFASELPAELKDIAMEAQPLLTRAEKDLLAQVVDKQSIDEGRAKKQVLSAWRALKDAISKGEIEHIRTQLPNATTAMLH